MQKKGKYIVELIANRNWPDERSLIAFHFNVKVVKPVTCIEHIFNEINYKDDLKILKNLKKGITINILTDRSVKDGDEGKMFNKGVGGDKENIIKIQPLFDENHFKFTNQEKEEVNNSKGKEKMDDETRKRNDKGDFDYRYFWGKMNKGISFN